MQSPIVVCMYVVQITIPSLKFSASIAYVRGYSQSPRQHHALCASATMLAHRLVSITAALSRYSCSKNESYARLHSSLPAVHVHKCADSKGGGVRSSYADISAPTGCDPSGRQSCVSYAR